MSVAITLRPASPHACLRIWGALLATVIRGTPGRFPPPYWTKASDWYLADARSIGLVNLHRNLCGPELHQCGDDVGVVSHFEAPR